MYSYHIINIITGERNIIFGYNFENACNRSKLNGNDWEILFSDYED